MLDLKCPKCAFNIVAAEINEHAAVAKCNRCGEVFKFVVASLTPPKPRIHVPKGIAVRCEGGDLLIIRRWFQPLWLLFLFSGLFFILVGILAIPRIFPNLNMVERYGIFLPFLPAIVLFYFGFCKLINHTEIRVNSQWVTIRHVPIPFTRSKRVDTKRFNQLYCVKEDDPSLGALVTFAVGIVLKGGNRQWLLSGISTKEQAMFIEQEIEKHLGIANRAVEGEIQP